MLSAAGPGATPTTTVVLVDPPSRVRAALAAALSAEPGIAVVAAVGGLAEALVMLHRHRPHAALMDIAVFGDRGVAGLGDLRLVHTATAVVAMALADAAGLARAAARHGVVDLVLTDAPPAEIGCAVRKAAKRRSSLRIVPSAE